MIGASKILTVSYGTFSCTLEGFEEPFNTMKAIAEYFRDLAADDRYFGAEPPTPDAAMLHKIAEREIQRRVEAKINENGVILRAEDSSGHFPVPQAVSLPRTPSLAPEATISSSESVAAKLSRLRAVQNSAQSIKPEADEFPDFAESTDFSEDEHSSDVRESLADFAANVQPAADTDLPEPTFAAYAPQDEDTLGGLIITDPVSDPYNHAATTPMPQPTPHEPVDFSYDLSEDFTPEDTITSAQELDDLTLLDGLGAKLAADRAAHAAMPDPDADLTADPRYFEDTLSDTAFGDDALAEDIAKAASQPLAVEPDTAEQDRAADDALMASLGAMIDPNDADDFEEIAEVSALADAKAPLLDAAAEAEITATATPPAPAETLAAANIGADDPAGAKSLRARARVIRIRRADPASQNPAAQTAPVSLLSAEAEAALQAELAALETNGDSPEDDLATLLAGIEADAAVEPLVTEERIQPEARKQLSMDDEDAAMSRLIAQANSAMDSADNKRRQSAVSHLKAAVAATEAERQITGVEPGEDTIESAYRSDLDRAVRPRRPSIATDNGQAKAAERSIGTERPTPLVLVSEQRIDRTVTVIAPVRPRRVTSLAATSELDEDGDDNLFDDSKNFAEFAESLGASELSEMLEAAAVYCAEVLKKPEFSRRHLLQQVRTLPEGDESSREDQLRSFGTLLRQGRITRMDSGGYALTDRSPLLAEAKRIAG